MDDFTSIIKNYKYLTLGDDNTCNVYKSLRDISNDTNIDYSTISKKLKDNNGEWCICKSKETKSHFYIKKIKIEFE